MKLLLPTALMASLALTACDVTHPVAVVGPSNTVYRGHATAAFLQGGWFQVSNGPNSCKGRYTPSPDIAKVTFPVTCSNGLKGVGTAEYESGRSGGGEIVMQDGTRWKFIFGPGALAL